MGDAGGSDRTEATDGSGLAGQSDEAADQVADRPQWATPTDGDFGWRGWVLVCVIVLSFLVVPGILVGLTYRPSLVGTVGLSFQDAYLALPMIPAIVLAVTAVWAALSARRR